MSAALLLPVLQHALGVDQHGRGRQFRNHFVTGAGSEDHRACSEAVRLGLMSRRKGGVLSGGDDVFQVTRTGRAYVFEHSPAPPKVSPCQQRYRDYLAADSGVSFIEWLRRPQTTFAGDYL
jgi:hypothetical protein